MAKSAYFDLTTKIISIEETNPDLLNTWLGGRGLGAAILYDRVGPSVKPFDPQNCLIFTTAHLSATAWPASSRYHVTFKSPATGAYGYANAGGYFGSELRKAGYDALIVTGKADEPVMIKVQQDGIEILPATDLWGLSTSAVDSLLRENQGGRVACIGQAGENLVYMASIMNDHGRAAARGGPGAVMGSKLLKAVHVIAPARRTSRTAEGFAEAAKKASQYVINHPRMQRLMSESTLFLMQAKQYIGDLPAKNHQVSSVPFIDKVDTKSFSRYWKKRTGCAACPIRCSRYIELENGQETISFEGPEYESTNALGPMCWNADPEVVIRANDLCNQYGLDTISTGVTIAFAMECHQRGLLNDEDISLEWGDEKTILGLIHKIALRRGLGNILADGTRRAVQKIGRGAERFAANVKGLEMPRQEPRVIKGMALTHAVANRGADHLYSLSTMDTNGLVDMARSMFPEEIVRQVLDTHDETYKPEIVIRGEHFCAIVDSLGICKFSTVQNYVILPDSLAEGLRALGVDMTEEKLFTIAERIVNLERMYNVRQGFSRVDDQLPRRFLEEPLDVYFYDTDEVSGKMQRSEKPILSGAVVDLDRMLDKYYALRGWDENGIPRPETLARLGLQAN